MKQSNILTKHIIYYLTHKGFFAWRQNSYGWQTKTGRWINPSGVRGVPDICGVSPDGRAIFVEVKIGKDKLSQYQEFFRAEAEKRGAVYIVARTIDDVIEKIL